MQVPPKQSDPLGQSEVVVQGPEPRPVPQKVPSSVLPQEHPLPGQSEPVEHGLAQVPLLSFTVPGAQAEGTVHTPPTQTSLELQQVVEA
jgi:hypothetical protein